MKNVLSKYLLIQHKNIPKYFNLIIKLQPFSNQIIYGTEHDGSSCI